MNSLDGGAFMIIRERTYFSDKGIGPSFEYKFVMYYAQTRSLYVAI